jgi:hypothetical protein
LEYCSNWSLGVVSTSSHDVVIQAGKAVTVTADAFAKSIVIMSTGILTIKQYYFNRFENVTINSGGSLMRVPEIMKVLQWVLVILLTKVLLLIFWKSSVIIAGDLFTSSTILQNNGDNVWWKCKCH